MRADDISVGQYVTVLRWEAVEQTTSTMMGSSVVMVTPRTFEGEVLRVEGVNLPFVAVHVVTGYSRCVRRSLDTRACELMRLSDDYVAAMGVEGSDA